MKITRIFPIACILLFASLSFGQDYFNLTKPFTVLPNQPGTCKYGQVITRSDLTLGNIVFMCGLSNNWVALGSLATLPNPSASTLGGIESIVPASHEWVDSISTSGVPHLSQPASSDLNDQANAPSLTPGDAVVDVTSNVFTDEASASSTTTISVGQTVSWKWVSGLHVVVSLSAHCGANPCASLEDQRFDSGDPTSSVGHRFAYTFTAPGTYYYYCDVHGQAMQGTVVVVQTATLHTPASSSEACTVGQVAYDSGFVYICSAPTTWLRAALSGF